MLSSIENKYTIVEEPLDNMTVLDVIRKSGIEFAAQCNGRGTCKKCVVIIDGEKVLSCEVKAEKGMTFEIPVASQVKADSIETDNFFKNEIVPDGAPDTYGGAVDIGTTTVVAYLYELDTGKRLGVVADMNPQKVFGADVISRIDYASKGESERQTIHNKIVECTNQMIDKLLKDTFGKEVVLKKVVVTGNTTMQHFFADWDASGIAVAPFTAYTYDSAVMSGEEAGVPKTESVLITPSVSAYVGGDIVCGITSCGMNQTNDKEMLIDIGTNGEMALSVGGKIYSCSTAAGPAFEGANIKCGMPGLDGAIKKVSADVENGSFVCETIGGTQAVGICGSGLLDTIAALLNVGLVDEAGRIVDDDELEPEYESFAGAIDEDDMGMCVHICDGKDSINITQKDVREVQNAKAAICAGIKVLCAKAGISVSDVNRVFLSGGFGTKLNPESAIRIGLLPQEFEGKIFAVGNSAGAGATEALLSEKHWQRMCEVAREVEYIELSLEPLFVDEYVEQMMFE